LRFGEIFRRATTAHGIRSRAKRVSGQASEPSRAGRDRVRVRGGIHSRQRTAPAAAACARAELRRNTIAECRCVGDADGGNFADTDTDTVGDAFADRIGHVASDHAGHDAAGSRGRADPGRDALADADRNSVAHANSDADAGTNGAADADADADTDTQRASAATRAAVRSGALACGGRVDVRDR
jgi:hypothetical protein